MPRARLILSLVLLHALLAAPWIAERSTAAPQPLPVTIDSRSATAPGLSAFRASEHTFRVTFKDGGTASPIAGHLPFMAWYTSTAASVVSTSTWKIIGASTGLVDFTFSPSSLNYPSGRYGYECGVTTDGAVRVYRRGVFIIEPSPFGTGATPIEWSTNWTWGTFGTPGWPDWQTSNEVEALITSATGALPLASGDITSITSDTPAQITISGGLTGDVGIGITNIAGAAMARIGASTFSTIQHMQDIFHSSGYSSGGAITTNTGGTSVTVAAGTGFIRATDDGTNTLNYFDWSADTFESVPSNATRYIGITYADGTPIVTSKTTYAWDNTTEFNLGSVVNEDNRLHVVNAPHAVGDHARFMIERTYQTQSKVRDDKAGGLVLGETGTRNVTVSTGALWEKLQRFSIAAIDTSAAGTFDSYVGATLDTAGATQWDNQNYDNGGTKTALANNRWAVLWFYIALDGGLICVYGTQEHTSEASADAESAPSTVPARVTVQGRLIGKLVFQDDAASAASIGTVWDTTIAGTAATDHGNLSGLADDDHTQYLLKSSTGAWLVAEADTLQTVSARGSNYYIGAANLYVGLGQEDAAIVVSNTGDRLLYLTPGAVADASREALIYGKYAGEGGIWIGQNTGVSVFSNGSSVAFVGDDNSAFRNMPGGPEGSFRLGDKTLNVAGFYTNNGATVYLGQNSYAIWVNEGDSNFETISFGNNEALKIKTAGLAANAALVYDGARGQWTNFNPSGTTTNALTANGWVDISGALGGGGEANTATGLGTGSNIVHGKSGVDLQFRSLVGGTGLDIVPGEAGSNLTLNVTISAAPTVHRVVAGQANDVAAADEARVKILYDDVRYDNSGGNYITNLGVFVTPSAGWLDSVAQINMGMNIDHSSKVYAWIYTNSAQMRGIVNEFDEDAGQSQHNTHPFPFKDHIPNATTVAVYYMWNAPGSDPASAFLKTNVFSHVADNETPATWAFTFTED